MNYDSVIWQYVKSKSVDEIIGKTFDINGFIDEFNRDVSQHNIPERHLRKRLSFIVKLAANAMHNTSQNVTVKLRPHEFRDLFSYINREYDAIYFNEKESKKLFEAFKDHPNLNNISILEHQFILNRGNATELFALMGNRIDPTSNTLTLIHQTFKAICDEMEREDYTYFFNENAEPRSQERLEAFFDYIFSRHYSGLMPVTHHQLWQFIKVASDQAKLTLFGKTNISEQDNIKIKNKDWNQFFEEVARHNATCQHNKIDFDLTPYQNKRIILNLPLEQALDYQSLFIDKLAGVGEKTLSTGSRAVIAVGQATKTMQILSGITDVLLKAAVVVKSFLILPFVAVVLLFAGHKNHKDKIKIERTQHKDFLLCVARINKLKESIGTAITQFQKLNDEHFLGTLELDQALLKLDTNPNQDCEVESEFKYMHPIKTRIVLWLSKTREKVSEKLKIIKPLSGPIFAGLLTSGGIFIIGMVFSTSLPFLIGLGCIALFVGALNVVYRYRTDKHKKNIRNILKRSSERESDLEDKLGDIVKLINDLNKRIEDGENPLSTRALNVNTPIDNDKKDKAELVDLKQKYAKSQTEIALLQTQLGLFKAGIPNKTPDDIHAQNNNNPILI